MLRAKDPNSNASFRLTLFEDDMINRFDMVNSTGQHQTIWFRAEVPVRKWNTMCLIRDTDDQVKLFEVYQNNENVYSYGNCKTVGPVSDYYKSQVKDEKCHNHTNWKFNVNILFIRHRIRALICFLKVVVVHAFFSCNTRFITKN